MIERLGASFASFAERWVPTPFVLAIGLTLLTFVLGVAGGASVATTLKGWGDGFWNLLQFGMQMSLVLVTGYALATSRLVSRGIDRLAAVPRGTRSAVALTSAVTLLVSLVHWGLGLIFGALLARQVGRTAALRGRAVHYPLVVAAAYAGFLSWHGGLSGSAPVKVAEDGHFLAAQIGVVEVGRTILSPLNLVVTLLLLAAVPLSLVLMAPRSGGRPAPEEIAEEAPARDDPSATPASRLDGSRLLGTAIAVPGLGYVAWRFAAEGFGALDPNLINFAFLFLGLLIWGAPAAYARAVGEGTKGASGIILQFPFYAGIQGMMVATGLLERMAEIGASVGKGGFLVATFLAAGVVNLFVPSGGGQWAVQGPVLAEASTRLGVPIERTILAFAYGDEWTNMLQPFWALALLGVTKLAARDIVGYTALVMFLTGPLYVLALLFA